MRVDVLLETFGSRWPEVRDAAAATERVGLDGVWLNDHLSGTGEGATHVLECWTVLSALAVDVPRITVGPLVLNIANRDPGTLGVMAATLQHISGGRLLLGLGAGARAGTSYAIEQEALGRRLPGDRDRRLALERDIGMLRRVWTGAVPPATGFLRPDPVPPILVGGSGPKMAELAGRVADGICVPYGPMMDQLIAVARRARLDSGRDPAQLVVTVSLASIPERGQFSVGPDVDRLIVYVGQPFDAGLTRLAEITRTWTTELRGGE